MFNRVEINYICKLLIYNSSLFNKQYLYLNYIYIFSIDKDVFIILNYI